MNTIQLLEHSVRIGIGECHAVNKINFTPPQKTPQNTAVYISCKTKTSYMQVFSVLLQIS